MAVRFNRWMVTLALAVLALGAGAPTLASVPKVVLGEDYTNTG